MNNPTTRTSSVLDTQEDLIRELTDECCVAPPQGKYMILKGKGNVNTGINKDEDADDSPDNQI